MRIHWTFTTLFCCLSLIFVFIPITKYFALHSYYYDLGIFQTLLHDASQNGTWGRLLQGHAHIDAILYALILRHVYQPYDAVFLLLIQSIALLIPLIFLYVRFGFFVAIVFFLYPVIWVNNHFEFHFDHLAVPLLLCFYLSFSSNRPVATVVSGLFLMLVKEVFALQTVACGLFILVQLYTSSSNLTNKRLQFIGVGFSLIIIGFCYFYFVTNYLIPYFSDGRPGATDQGAFSWLGDSKLEMFMHLFLHPFDIASQILFTPGKLLYLSVIFGTIAFIPFLAPIYLIPALPILLIALLSQDPRYYNLHNHYTVGLIIPVMFAFVNGLPKARELYLKCVHFFAQRKLLYSSISMQIQVRKKLNYFSGVVFLCVFVGHIAIAPSPFSWWFWSDKLWAYSWHAYYVTPRDRIINNAIQRIIPVDPTFSVSAQTSVNNAHLAHRNVYRSFPDGIEDPIIATNWSECSIKGFLRSFGTEEAHVTLKSKHYADYVVLDLKRPWFISDRSCIWHHSVCEDKQVAKEFLEWINKTNKYYQTVFEYDSFMIMKRIGIG